MDQKRGRFQNFVEAALVISALVFGVFVELRGAFMEHRHTDAGVYFRAGWAARTGQDIYLTTDENGWHFFYPPLTAIAFWPLADAPAGQSRAGMMPYAVSLGAWYALSIVMTAVGAHRLAVELKRASPGITLPFWQLRDAPIAACLPVIARSLARGQVGPLWLMLMCGMLIAMMQGKRARAGLWLAGTICLKVIPLFLLIEPAWRRSWRMLAGCAVGLALGVLVIPTMVMGTSRATKANRDYAQLVLWPGLTGQDLRQSSALELVDSVTFDTQNYREIIKHTIESLRGEAVAQRAGAWLGAAHWLIAGILTAITLWASTRQKRLDAIGILLSIGGLTIVMLGAAPVCHAHYFILQIPLMMGLCACVGAGKPVGWLNWATYAMVWLNPLAHILTVLPHMDVFRDLGVVLYAALALWGVGILHLLRRACEAEKGKTEREGNEPIAAEQVGV